MIQRVYLTPKGRQQNIENTKFKYEHHFVICLSSSLIKILNYLIILVFNIRTFISDFNTVKCLFMFSSWSSCLCSQVGQVRQINGQEANLNILIITLLRLF